MKFYCAITGNEESDRRTLAFAEKEEFFNDKTLLSKLTTYMISNWNTMERKISEVRQNSQHPEIPEILKDGWLTIRPPYDPVYNYHIVKYWFEKGDQERVISGFGVSGL